MLWRKKFKVGLQLIYCNLSIFFSIKPLITLSIKCQKIMKGARYNVPEPKIK